MKCLMTDEAMPIFGDGSATRDFLHVDDLCDGILQAVTTDIEPGDVFHLASGEETTIMDLADTIADIAVKPDHPIAFYGKRQSEVTRNFARYEKASKVLGFQPQISLRQGLEETWRWFEENGEQVLSEEETDS